MRRSLIWYLLQVAAVAMVMLLLFVILGAQQHSKNDSAINSNLTQNTRLTNRWMRPVPMKPPTKEKPPEMKPPTKEKPSE